MSSLQGVINVFKENGYSIVRTLNKVPIIKNWTQLIEKPDLFAGNLLTAKEAGFVIPDGIVVVDVDPRNFKDNIDSLEELNRAIDFDIELHATFKVKTASGGYHFYYKKRLDVKFPNSHKDYPGIEFKQRGQQVILPTSILPDGRSYELLEGNLSGLADLFNSFYDIIGIKTPNIITTGVGYKDDPKDIQLVRERLARMPGAVQGQNGDQATYNVCCLGKDYGLSPSIFIDLLLEWNEKCTPPWGFDELKQKMTNGYNYAQNTAGANSILNDEWKKDLQINKSGAYRTTLKNAVLFIRNSPVQLGILGYDQFTRNKFWPKKPDWVDNNRTQWTDEDAIQIRYYLNSFEFDISVNLIDEAAVIVSSENKSHPVKEWFKALPAWDGIARLDTFFSKYCGAEQNEYTASLGRKLLCAIISRVMVPGCKFDLIPIFIGEGGTRKSSLIEILSIKKEWFCNNIGDITNAKELVPQTSGKLVVEWQELTMYNKLDINAIKASASTQVDRVRRSHARHSEDYPRQFICIATTNQHKFLLDETGERRITPIELHGVIDFFDSKKKKKIKVIDTDSVQRDLKQLYAEAIIYYKNGENLFLDTAEAQNIYDEECEKRFKNDVLEDVIADWLDNIPKELKIDKEKLQVSDIIIHCLKESTVKDRGLSNRVGNILRRLGYKPKAFREDKKVKYGFVKEI